MQIEQRFELPLPPGQAWPAFHDLALLAECLPGAAVTGEPQGGEVPLRFEVKLGPIAAAFLGAGKVTFDEPARAGRFEGAAADRKTNSRVKGAADFALAESHGGGTAVTVRVDYTLSGMLAQFGRAGIVRELATVLTAQFAANLEQRLKATLPTAAQAAEPPVDAQPQFAAASALPRPPASVPLSGFDLLRQVLRAYWIRFNQRLTPRRSR